MKRQKNYDKKVKLTRILLGDYLVLKRMSLAAGVSMSEALHRLIEHQAQLPLLDMAAKPMSAIATQPGLSSITAKPVPAIQVIDNPAIHVINKPAFRTVPVTSIATNGSKGTAFRIKSRGARYA